MMTHHTQTDYCAALLCAALLCALAPLIALLADYLEAKRDEARWHARLLEAQVACARRELASEDAAVLEEEEEEEESS